MPGGWRSPWSSAGLTGRRKRGAGGSGGALFSRTAGTAIAPNSTFTGDANATYWDNVGILRTRVANQLRGAPYRTNLVIQSTSILVASGWTLNSGVEVVAGGQLDPFGGNTGTSITAVSAANSALARAVTLTGDGTKSYSVYVKQGTGAPRLDFRDETVPVVRAGFSIAWASGVPVLTLASGGGTAIAQPALNGYWRIVITVPGVIAANLNRIYLYPDNPGAIGSTIFAGPQAENTPTATPYIPTFGAIVTVSDGQGGLGVAYAVRTNSALFSNDLTNAAWVKAGTGATAKDAPGVNGAPNTACTFTDTDAASATAWTQSGIGISNDGATHAATFYFAKTVGTTSYPLASINYSGGGALTYAVILNTDTGVGTVNGGAGSFRVYDAGNGFWALEMLMTNNTSGNVSAALAVYPAYSTIPPAVNAAATGTKIFGGVNFEQNKRVGSALIVTGAVPVSVWDTPIDLMEGARTNTILWSRDLTNAGVWTFAGTGTRVQNAVGLDGTANSATTVTDSDAAAAVQLTQSAAVANDNATHSVAFWIKKDTDQTRFPGCQLLLNGGATIVNRVVHLNTQTGASATQTATAGSSHRVIDAGLWWVVEITATNNTTGNVTIAPWFYPALATVMGTNNVAATGSCVSGQIQLELNSVCSSTPIFTTAATVTRARDAFAIPFTQPERELTLYLRYFDYGTQLGTRTVISVGDALALPFLNIFAPVATVMRNAFHNGAVQLNSDLNPSNIVIGDLVELRVTFALSGISQLGVSRNGAAESLAPATAGQALGNGWGSNVILINNYNSAVPTDGLNGFQAIKIAAGTQSLATMRTL